MYSTSQFQTHMVSTSLRSRMSPAVSATANYVQNGPLTCLFSKTVGWSINMMFTMSMRSRHCFNLDTWVLCVSSWLPYDVRTPTPRPIWTATSKRPRGMLMWVACFFACVLTCFSLRAVGVLIYVSLELCSPFRRRGRNFTHLMLLFRSSAQACHWHGVTEPGIARTSSVYMSNPILYSNMQRQSCRKQSPDSESACRELSKSGSLSIRARMNRHVAWSGVAADRWYVLSTHVFACFVD
jgi:hypothetical protein